MRLLSKLMQMTEKRRTKNMKTATGGRMMFRITPNCTPMITNGYIIIEML